MAAYDQGDRVRLGNGSTAVMPGASAAVFANLAGTATDPTAAVLTVRAPDGTTTEYAWPTPGAGQLALTKETTGRFYADVTLDQGGIWEYELAGTGNVVAAASGWLAVRESRVA